MEAQVEQTVETEAEVVAANESGFKVEFRVSKFELTYANNQEIALSIERSGKIAEGASLVAEFDSRGAPKTTSVGDNPRGLDDATVRSMLASLCSSRLGFMGIVLPEGEMRKGGTWTYRMTLAKLFEGTGLDVNEVSGDDIEVKYVLKAIEEENGSKVALIGFSMIAEFDVPVQVLAAMSKQNQYQRVNGTARVELATGIPLVIESSTEAITRMKVGTDTQKTKSKSVLVK
jgi:hypothetical protein